MADWKKTIIEQDTPVRRAIEVIDAAALQIALVVDGDGRLLGTVTDGDVRRAILSGVDLDRTVDAIMNPNPITVRQNDEADAVLELMRRRRLHQIPVLDAGWRVVGLEVLDDLLRPEPKANPVVLMAGGLGSRLRPLTEDCPKPLLRVGSRPILETILQGFVRSGFHRFYISVNYRADMIEDYFGDGSRHGVEIQYLRESESLGTAGALSLLPERPTEPFFVMNGDLVTQLDFSRLMQFHLRHGADATMCVREYEMQVPYGVVEVEGPRIRDIVEKPREKYLINAGVYVLDPEVVDLVPTKTLDMPELLAAILERDGEAMAFPIREYWMDIGRPEDLRRAGGDYREMFESDVDP